MTDRGENHFMKLLTTSGRPSRAQTKTFPWMSLADGFEGAETDHYRVAEMMFDSAEAMAESAESEAWATLRGCSGDIIERFGVELRVEAGEYEKGTPTA